MAVISNRQLIRIDIFLSYFSNYIYHKFKSLVHLSVSFWHSYSIHYMYSRHMADSFQYNPYRITRRATHSTRSIANLSDKYVVILQTFQTCMWLFYKPFRHECGNFGPFRSFAKHKKKKHAETLISETLLSPIF